MKVFMLLALMMISGRYTTLPLLLPGRTGKFLVNDSLPLKPLSAPSVSVTDNVCGMKITDPYRNLENLKDPGVQRWMKSQADYARSTLDLLPGKKKITDIFKKFDERKMFWPEQLKKSENGGYFYLGKNTGEPHAKLYYRSSYTSKEVLLFDPGAYGSEKGKNWDIMEFEPSPDGKHVLFTISAGGTETGYLLCMDVAAFRLLPEVITPVKRYAAWISNTSFTYRTLNSADVHEINHLKLSKGFIHILGRSRAKDREIFTSSLYPELQIDSNETAAIEHADISSDYIIGVVFNADRDIKIYSTRVTGFNKAKPVFKELVRKPDEVLDYKIKKNTLFLLTRKDASNYKVLQMDLQDPDLAKATVIVPEFKDARITDVQVTRDALYISTLKNGVIAGLYRKEYGSKPVEAIPLPLPAGSLKFVSAGSNADDLLITASGWLTGGKTFRYNAVTKEFSPLLLGTGLVYPEFNNLAVEEMMVPSYDGTMVPVSLVYQNGLKKDGNNPLWLTGYGSYGRSETPFFSPLLLSFTRFGGIVGIVHVRGGGELGDGWQEAGRKVNKPNTWKDFIAAAEYLISEKYSSAKKTGIYGASAGGILVGRAMTERPELFAVAVSGVGVMNPLRFENSPNGGGSAAEFGTVKDLVECRALFEMDAYHHIKEGVSYPATLLTAGMNDPRVIAWQPAKFAARLQAAAKGGKPVLFLTDYDAGHGPTRSYFADVMSFILWQTGHPDFQPL